MNNKELWLTLPILIKISDNYHLIQNRFFHEYPFAGSFGALLDKKIDEKLEKFIGRFYSSDSFSSL